jgi:outer membrane murein-binding lipoprotein Lpp
MLASKKTKRGVIGAIVLAGVLAVGGYAYTNVATINDLTNAGDGVDTVSTLNVDDDSITWDNNTTTPDIADAVHFSATASGALANGGTPGAPEILATTVAYVQVVSTGATITNGSTGGDWFACTTTGGAATATFDCPLTGGTSPVAFADVDQFRAVINDAP